MSLDPSPLDESVPAEMSGHLGALSVHRRQRQSRDCGASSCSELQCKPAEPMAREIYHHRFLLSSSQQTRRHRPQLQPSPIRPARFSLASLVPFANRDSIFHSNRRREQHKTSNKTSNNAPLRRLPLLPRREVRTPACRSQHGQENSRWPQDYGCCFRAACCCVVGRAILCRRRWSEQGGSRGAHQDSSPGFRQGSCLLFLPVPYQLLGLSSLDRFWAF